MKQNSTNQVELNTGSNIKNRNETDNKPRKDNKLDNLSSNGKIMTNPNTANNNPGSINVVCRFRPLNEKEKNISQETCCEFIDYTQIMIRSSGENNAYKFNFDRVFDPNSNQQEVYDFSAKNIVESVLEGFNGTIFAYGQTSSGKTHTMQGIIDNPEKEGIIPRMIRHLFNFIVNSSSDTEYIVKVSMIEIYMEKIRDLIDTDRQNLNVREDKTKGIYIEELSEHYVASEEEVLDIMKLGSDNRSVASTNMNEHSSRSHSIFIMTIHQNNIKDLSAKTGKLYLVDLAGSEKISKTGATGLTLEEAKTINKSLTTLGMVINSLTDGKSTHIPYRESKLTRVLQESLGGNAKTCLIITCSPSSYNDAETLSTLRFGLRAKKIKNKPKINKETTVAELKLEIDKMDKTIQKLNRRIVQLENYIIKNNLHVPSEEGDDDHLEDNHIDLEENFIEEIKNNEKLIPFGENLEAEEDHKNNEYNQKSVNLSDEKNSRITAGFNNNEKTSLNNKKNNENSKLISEDEMNRNLKEQQEFFEHVINMINEELYNKKNFAENIQKINIKLEEDYDQLKFNYDDLLKNTQSNKKSIDNLLENQHIENLCTNSEEKVITNTDNFENENLSVEENNHSNILENSEKKNENNERISIPKKIENEVEDKFCDKHKELSENKNENIFKIPEQFSDRISTGFINSENKINNFNMEENNLIPLNLEMRLSKNFDKDEIRSESIMDIYQKLKKEKSFLQKSTNFPNIESFLANTININSDVFKKNSFCQTEDLLNLESENNNVFRKKSLNNHNEESNNNDNKDLIPENKTFINDIISKIENLNKKIKNESNLIENIKNFEKKNYENPQIIKTEQNSPNEINPNFKIENQMQYVIGQLDNFISEFKQTPISNPENPDKKEEENKNNQEYIDQLIKSINSENEEKLENEIKKHDNEKKTILKVLEEKCEKYNFIEVENGDLKNRIKSLEVKMTPDEKTYKKVFVKLEQNIEQLNLSLEKTVSEKTQLAINLKVKNNIINKKGFRKKVLSQKS